MKDRGCHHHIWTRIFVFENLDQVNSPGLLEVHLPNMKNSPILCVLDQEVSPVCGHVFIVYTDYWHKLSLWYNCKLDRLMNKDPLQRPSATEILQDPFIKRHLQVCMVCMAR